VAAAANTAPETPAVIRGQTAQPPKNFRIALGDRHQHTDDARALLCACGERQRRQRAAEETENRPSLHADHSRVRAVKVPRASASRGIAQTGSSWRVLIANVKSSGPWRQIEADCGRKRRTLAIEGRDILGAQRGDVRDECLDRGSVDTRRGAVGLVSIEVAGIKGHLSAGAHMLRGRINVHPTH
jgi:hypothetical protein